MNDLRPAEPTPPARRSPPGHPSPRSLVLGVAACIFAAEVVIMGLFRILPETPQGLGPVLDAGALLLVLAPALHFLVVRPMAREIARRARAEERWRQSEERFRRAFEDAPIGMALVGTDDRYLQVNRALCEILGYAPEHLLGLRVPEVTHPEDLSAEESLKSHVRSGAARGFQMEKRYLHRDGHVVWGQLGVSSVTDPAGQLLYAIQQLEDITERKQAERELREARDQLEERVLQRTAELEEINLELLREVEHRRRAQDALRESERKYSTLVESSLTGIFIHQDGKIAFVNRTGAELLGYRVTEVEGADTFGLLHPDERARARGLVARGQRGEGAEPELEVRALTRGGEARWLNIRASRIEYHGRPAILGNALDVTQRKEAQAALAESQRQLKRLSAELLRAQELERGRMARELHDGLGQSLSAVKFMVENALQELGPESPGPGAEALRAVVPRLQSTVQDVRRISMALRPSTLDDLGLLPTLGWFCREFQTTHPTIRVERRVQGDEAEIPEGLKIVIYRIVQEAMNNVAKHSLADRVEVRLERDAEGLELAVGDNGVGFDPEAVARNGRDVGLGLRSMAERAALSGGAFELTAAPGAGVTVRVRWPAAATGTG